MAWDRPVGLNVGGQGALFAGAAGTFQYQISNAAADRTLYDVTDPRAPQLLDIPPGTTTTFQDGPIAPVCPDRPGHAVRAGS